MQVRCKIEYINGNIIQRRIAVSCAAQGYRVARSPIVNPLQCALARRKESRRERPQQGAMGGGWIVKDCQGGGATLKSFTPAEGDKEKMK